MPRLRTLFLLAVLWALPFAATAVEVSGDVTMIFIGYLSPSSDGKVTPGDYDTLLLVNEKTGKTEATAVYDTSGGVYWVQIDKPASFNGTILLPRLSQSGTLYKLLNAATSDDARLTFAGGSVFDIKTLKINLVATGSVIGSTSTGTTPGGTTPGTTPGGTTPGGTAPEALAGDINGDGKADDLDVQLLKQGISGQVAMTTRMDVNKDRVINTRDLIDLIRVVRTQGGTALRQTASSAPVTAAAATPVAVIYTRPPTTRDQINAINLAREKEQTALQPAPITKQAAPATAAAAPVTTSTRAPTTREQIDAINRARAEEQSGLKPKPIIPGP